MALLSLGLMAGDQYTRYGDMVRSYLVTGLSPVYWLARVPEQLGEWGQGLMESRESLQSEVESLNARLLVLERRAQQYASLAAENNRLRDLLNASSRLDDSVLVAEVIGITPDPFSHEILLDKGSRAGVREGQAVLDARGLMGQVVHVSHYVSRAVLISDNSHAVPVEVNRNGVRAVMLGTGNQRALELAHVPDTADIEVGDLLVSSGLGGRFPQGYPVAEVSHVEHHPGAPFARVMARPLAELDRSRLVMVVFTPEVTPVRGATDALEEGE